MLSSQISCRSWGLLWYGDCPKPRCAMTRSCQRGGASQELCAYAALCCALSIVGGRTGQTGYINREARESGLDQAWNDG